MHKSIFPVIWGIWFSAIVLAGPLRADDETNRLYSEGKKAFRSCAACHSVTEPTLKEDDDWLKLNQVTACISAGEMTPRVRKALDVYFRSSETRRPLLVDENYTPEEGMVLGKINLPTTSGSAYLKAERESIRQGSPSGIRLYWKDSEKGKSLSIPAGKYRVITYRFYRVTGEGKDQLWTLSVTDVNGCGEIDIGENETVNYDFLPEMRGTLSAEKAENGIKLSLAIRNERDSTLTLSKNGDMCLPRFAIFNPSGKEIRHAAFENT
ncbi:MAG: hypothetical protein KJ645_11255 [Planctomycetes bacterium]|nr:hypothetical protein [Planctomycetota bacterium]